MKGTRLQLRKVDFHLNYDANKCRASVQLRLGKEEFLSHYEADINEFPLRVIALATFAAVNEALRAKIDMTIEISLRVVEEMHPMFMEKSLFVVIVEIVAGKFTFKPTGAVVADSHDAHRATAAAALDSVNRLVHHLLTLHSY